MSSINTNYEKITDDLCFLGSNVVVRFNVILAKKNEEGKRVSFHREYEYMMNKYNDSKNLVTIRRQFDYYLSIENIKEVDGVKEYIFITPQDFIHFKQNVLHSVKWFTDSEFNNLFAKKGDNIVMLGKVNPIDIPFSRGNKSIRIEPTILNYENNNLTGVRIYLCSMDNYVDIDIDRYMGFVYLVSSLNMFQSAQIVLNYLGRPEDGTNRISFGIDNNSHNKEGIHGQNRTTNYKPKSFFNKVDDM